MLKRICAFCLILALTVSLVTVLPVSAASDSQIQLVADLGIIDASQNTGLIPAGFNRGDFAHSLCLMERNDNGLAVSAEEAAAYASDIAENTNCNYIAAVMAAGYMEADSEGKFNPGKSVSLSEAVTALVKMLGYEPMAQANGGTYDDYYAIALKIGLMSGVSVENSDKLNIEEAAEILTNAMGANMFLPDNIDYGEKCLWDRWNLRVNTGKILANSNMGLLVDRTESNHVNIDGEIYYTGLLIENELVGSNVTYYTTDGDMGDEVVSIYVKDYGDTITLKPHEIESLSDNGTILTIKTDDKKQLKVDKKGFLIVNGNTQSPSMAMFNLFESGTATFVDSDNNGSYDVVHMTLLFQTVLDGVNAESQTLATRYDGQTVKLERIDNYEVYLGKKTATLADLKPGMAVGIASDSYTVKDGKLVLSFTDAEYIRIYASSRQSEGYITAMLDDDKFEIEEMTKRFGSGYKRLVKGGFIPKLKLGDYVTAYYDNMGQLTYFEVSDSSDSMKYGYMIKAGVAGSLSKTTQIKVLETNGDISIYETGKKFVLDGEKVNSGSTVYTVNTSDDVDLNKRQLIRYRVVEGALKEIDTKVVSSSAESADSSLDEVLPFDVNKEGNAQYKVRSGAIDRKYAFTSDCIMFVDEAAIGDTNPSDQQFSVGKASSIGTEEYYMSGYDANLNNELACIVRYDSYAATEGDSKQGIGYHERNCYVVESVKNSKNADDEWGWTLSLVGDSKEVTHFVSEDNIKLYTSKSAEDWGKERIDVYKEDVNSFTEVIKKGDVIRFTTNEAGNIVYIEKMFDFEDHKNGITKVPDTGGQIYGFAKVEKVSGTNVLYNYNDPKDDTTYIFRKRSVFSTVPLYHVGSGEVELVDISAIPSEATGNEVKVFLRYYNYGIVYDHIFYIYD